MKIFLKGTFVRPVSGFEQMTLIAFEYFKREQVDIVILEMWEADLIVLMLVLLKTV